MRSTNRNRITTSKILFGMAVIALYGCGGGGGGTALVTRGTNITGTVVAPEGQTRAAGIAGERAAETLVPLSGAKIVVSDLTTGVDLPPVTTGTDGKYAVSDLNAGDNYLLHISKDLPSGKQLTLKAVVTPDQGSNSKDVTPTTTVAAAAIEEKIKDHPEFKTTPLGTLTKDLEDKHPVTVTPDLTDDNALKNAAKNLISQAAPHGSYFGSYSGTGSGKLAGLFADGKFMLCIFPDGSDGKPSVGGFAVGTVDANGTVNGASDDGKVTIKGTFSEGEGSGTFTSTDSTGGKWQIHQVSQTYAGLYSGHFQDNPAQVGRFFVLFINQDKTAWSFWVSRASSDPNRFKSIQLATGQMDSAFHLSLSATTAANGQTYTTTMTGVCDPTAGTVSGTFNVQSGGTGYWGGSRQQLDLTALNPAIAPGTARSELPPPPPTN